MDGSLRGTPTEFGLRTLKDILEASLIPQVSVDVLNRFWDYQQNGMITGNRKTNPTRLTPELLQKYDQIWFFGQHLGNLDGQPTAAGNNEQGYPESELNPSELQALASWMNGGGGVLMTGDHSNTVPSNQTLLWNLGRALGQNVHRAGKMRVWEGGPAAYTNIVNTSGDTPDMVKMPKQEDPTPQDIYPMFWDICPKNSHGRVIFCERHWHELFAGSIADDGLGIIRIFPDHGHEGALDIPSIFDSGEWPTANNGYQPKPVVIAHGINQDNQQKVGLVSAYDGHAVGVGRIVAHSTWHHYVDVNLHGFHLPTSPIETLQIIGEYYVNVAWYLMPMRMRRLALRKVLVFLLNQTIIHDLTGAPTKMLGAAAYKVLSEVATIGQISSLIFLATEEYLPPTQDNGTLQLPLPSHDWLLGGLIEECQHAGGISDIPEDHPDHDETIRSIIRKGIHRALKSDIEALEVEAKGLRSLINEKHEIE